MSVHVRPSVPEGFAGCDGAAGSALPAAGSPWAALFGVAPAEEAFGAPPAPLGAKFTAPYPGQAPVSESEALAAAAGHAPASPEEKAELAAKLAAAQKREAEEREANKGFFERYQVRRGGVGGGWGVHPGARVAFAPRGASGRHSACNLPQGRGGEAGRLVGPGGSTAHPSSPPHPTIRAQSFLLPLGIVFAIQSLFGKPEPEAKPTKPGAAGGGAAGGAAGPARVVPAAKPARLAAAAAEAK